MTVAQARVPSGGVKNEINGNHVNQALRDIHVFSAMNEFLWDLVKFKQFTDFHDFSLKNLPQTFVFPLFPASGERGIFLMIFYIYLWKINILIM